jgi:copper(I)-binding protein
MRHVFPVLFSAALVLAGCQAFTSSGPGIVASAAWGRPSPKIAGATAVYVVIENKGGQADRLTGAASAAAKTVELHESYMENNVMKMRPVAGLDIPAGGKVELKPGGYHIMLIDPVKPLAVGDEISVTLKLAKAGEQTVAVKIREQ